MHHQCLNVSCATMNQHLPSLKLPLPICSTRTGLQVCFIEHAQNCGLIARQNKAKRSQEASEHRSSSGVDPGAPGTSDAASTRQLFLCFKLQKAFMHRRRRRWRQMYRLGKANVSPDIFQGGWGSLWPQGGSVERLGDHQLCRPGCVASVW